MLYFSTFSGIWGFEHAMARVFPSAECVGYSEINRFPVMMYQRSFPSHKNYGDISKIDAESLPCFDMLVGGFPCQPHSRIGNKKGFNDPRGKLFFDVIRIAEVKKPKFIVLENVEGLATGKDGEEKMNVVLGSIIKAGYRPSYRLLNASEYCDIPQARKRLFIIGIRDDIYKEGFRYRWPDKSPCKVTFADILDKPGEIDSSLVYSAKQIDSLFRESKGKERIERGFHQDSERMYARTVVANIHKGFPCDVIIDRNLCQHGFFGCEFAGSDEWWCDSCEDACNYQDAVDGNASFRRWSARELERAFGFPVGSSDVHEVCITQKKKAFGNSVVVPLVERVLEGFLIK